MRREGEVKLACPYCGDHPTHKHLYVNAEKGVFHCFLCGESGTIKKLLREFPGLKPYLGFVGIYSNAKKRLRTDYIFFPLMEKYEENALKKQAIKYLRMRGLTLSEIFNLSPLLCPMRLPGYIVFPDSQGPDVFWCARSFLGRNPKWVFPEKGTTKKDKWEYVWGLERIKERKEIWICEGIFDAIAVGGVAVLGKVPTNKQLQIILNLEPESIVVAFDNDARQEAEETQKKLRPLVKTRIVFPPKRFKDFGETLKFRKGKETVR